MAAMTVWTKQHVSVLDTLEREGRYVAKRRNIAIDAGEDAGIVFAAYDWLTRNHPDAARKPADADFPIWLSYSGEAAMLPSEGTVLLRLEVDPDLVTPVNIAKWGAILNYSYIPRDRQDADRHRALLEAYGVSDAKAFMSQFYPQIKREILDSWPRLFDDSIQLGNTSAYGLIWEMRKEWLREAAR